MSGYREKVKRSLFLAVSDGDLWKVKLLVNCYGLSYVSDWSNGYIFLCYAVKFGRVEIVNFLLQKGTPVNQNADNSPLHLAAERGHVDIVEMLLDREADLDARNGKNETPLHLATQMGHKDVVRVLLSRGAFCCALDNANMEPLLVAVDKADYDIFNLLISYRRRCFVSNLEPLHLALCKASACGKEGMVLGLLDSNADPDAVIDPRFPTSPSYSYYREHGLSPLLLACEQGYRKIVNALLQGGAQTDRSRPKDKFKPLHIASERGFVEIAGLLLDKGANPNATCAKGLTPLHLAAKREIPQDCLQNVTARKECLELIEMLLNRGANVGAQSFGDAQSFAGAPPPLLALQHKRNKVFELLLKRGACINIKDENNHSPFDLALQNRNWPLLSFILRYRHDVDEVNNAVLGLLPSDESLEKIVDHAHECNFITKHKAVKDIHSLPNAIRKGDLKLVENILASGADPTDAKYGSALLHHAVERGHVEVIKLLLRSGCDVNSKRKEDSKTPLSLSFYHDDETKHFEMIKLLLANGADMKEAPDLLHNAVEEERIEVCEFLIQSGADVNGRSKFDDTPLHRTAPGSEDGFFTLYWRHEECCKKVDEAKRVEMARLLLKNGASINSTEDGGHTTLHSAAMNGWSQLTQLLLKFKADVNAKNDGFGTPLHFAVKGGYKDLAEILLEYGAEVDVPLYDGNQKPLHIAAHRGYREMVKLLLKFDADINARDTVGNSALHCAVRQNQHEIVTTLLVNGCNINIKNDSDNTAFDLLVPPDFDMYVDDTEYLEMYDDLLWTDSDEDQENVWSCSYHGGCTKDEVINAIANHINKLKVAGITFNIDKSYELCIRTLLRYRSDRKNQKFDSWVFAEHECKKEVEEMRKVKLSSDLTLYDILTHYTDPTFVKSKSIAQTVKYLDLCKFPIYRNLIEDWSEKNERMETLSSKGLKWLNILIETSSALHQRYSPHLPVELLREIVSYLEKRDLNALICCGRDLKRQLCR